MKFKLLLSSLAAILLAVSCSPSFARFRDQRHDIIRENVETEQAIKDHPDLSRREYKDLMKRNRKIEQQEKRYAEKHGGKLKKKEARRLHEAQDEVNYDLKKGEYSRED